MPPKRRYSSYLWDAQTDVPSRSKYRFERRGSLTEPSCSKDATLHEQSSGESSSDEEEQGYNNASTSVPCDEDSHVEEELFCEGTSSTQPCEVDVDERIFDEASDSESISSSDGSHSDQSEHDDACNYHPDELDDALFPGARLTRAESFLMVMAHSLRHGCSKEATESLVRLIGAHLPDGVSYPSSKYSFFRQFCAAESHYVKHYYCGTCFEYLGELTEETELSCRKCGSQHTVEGLQKSSHFFLVLDLKTQLRDLLESQDIQKEKPALSYDVTDITQSLQYHKLPLAAGDLTLTFNTDGVPLFESSKVSMWPILGMVNELPFKQRVQKLVFAGLWLGSSKPPFNCFLLPFVRTMNELSSEGLAWQDKDGNTHVTKVYPGPCAVDTVARCDVTHMTQFNGMNGCTWCEEPGSVVPKGNGFCRVYPPTTPAPKLRTPDSFLEHARHANMTRRPSCGVKGSSILTLLAFFSFTTGFVVDYMHAVCLGFVRATMFVWLKSDRCRQFQLRHHLGDANNCLLKLTPVWELSRLPRSLLEVKDWKASDWRSWLLFYSPIVLKGYVPQRHYKHWMKFVNIMHYLLGPSVCAEELVKIRNEMYEFLTEYQDLYGVEQMTYNSHLLQHLVDSALNWGPLWGYSLFPFEHMNGTLGMFVQGTRYAHYQIVQKFTILQALSKLWSQKSSKLMQSALGGAFTSLIKGYALRKKFVQQGTVAFFGKGIKKSDGMEFKKIQIGPFRFCTEQLDKSRRRNSYVCANGVFGRIVRILSRSASGCDGNHEVEVHLKVFTVEEKVLSDFHLEFVKVQPTTQHCIVNTDSIKKCICLDRDTSTFLCTVSDNLVLEAV